MDQVSDSASAAGVDRLWQQWDRAIRNSDLDSLCALVTEDATFWTHGAAAMHGRAALRAAFAGLFERYQLTQRFERIDLVIRGDLAFMNGVEHNTLQPRDGGAAVVVEQRAFSVMRLGADGQWRFWRGMTNQAPQAAN